jgi:uncharacterized protein YxeA
MKKLLVILVSVLSLNIEAAEFNLQEIKDEFTDQRIATMLTIMNDAMLGAVAFRCDDMMFALTLAQPGFYKTGETVEVKFRFDSKNMFSEELILLKSQHVISMDKVFIMKILEEFKNSEKAIIKIATEATFEFSQYSGIAPVIDEFIVRSKENSCIN